MAAEGPYFPVVLEFVHWCLCLHVYLCEMMQLAAFIATLTF